MVHYYDEGRGPAVLLIHGSLQDLYDWDIWTEQLKKDFRVVRLDLPSLGFTGRVRLSDYSIDNTMRTVDALMDRLGERRFTLVGTSYGGIVAFRYAATRTDRAAALILMNSAGVEWGNSKQLTSGASRRRSWRRSRLPCSSRGVQRIVHSRRVSRTSSSSY
jgi:pimeloyl-ACP methyl ester carboxylesterase